ncbi:hypothetical protein PC116_g31228 [Phytophthora cactorum]|nr:hypothetical protein PC116_g31228 [Phytophthora cactorum]
MCDSAMIKSGPVRPKELKDGHVAEPKDSKVFVDVDQVFAIADNSGWLIV